MKPLLEHYGRLADRPLPFDQLASDPVLHWLWYTILSVPKMLPFSESRKKYQNGYLAAAAAVWPAATLPTPGVAAGGDTAPVVTVRAGTAVAGTGAAEANAVC